jgi:hypothetical protein
MAECDLDNDNAAEAKGENVAIIRGQDDFADKVGRAVAAGAVGVIVINNDEQSPHEVIVMSGPEPRESSTRRWFRYLSCGSQPLCRPKYD